MRVMMWFYEHHDTIFPVMEEDAGYEKLGDDLSENVEETDVENDEIGDAEHAEENELLDVTENYEADEEMLIGVRHRPLDVTESLQDIPFFFMNVNIYMKCGIHNYQLMCIYQLMYIII